MAEGPGAERADFWTIFRRPTSLEWRLARRYLVEGLPFGGRQAAQRQEREREKQPQDPISAMLNELRRIFR